MHNTTKYGRPRKYFLIYNYISRRNYFNYIILTHFACVGRALIVKSNTQHGPITCNPVKKIKYMTSVIRNKFLFDHLRAFLLRDIRTVAHKIATLSFNSPKACTLIPKHAIDLTLSPTPPLTPPKSTSLRHTVGTYLLH